MSEQVGEIKASLGEALGLLGEGDPATGYKEFLFRLQLAQNALIQNERKIWLRTKVGKEMLSEFSNASGKLLGLLKSGGGQEDIEGAVGELEAVARKMNEETRRRSMVVT